MVNVLRKMIIEEIGSLMEVGWLTKSPGKNRIMNVGIEYPVKGKPINADFILKSDGWFRNRHDYGLMIREISLVKPIYVITNDLRTMRVGNIKQAYNITGAVYIVHGIKVMIWDGSVHGYDSKYDNKNYWNTEKMLLWISTEFEIQPIVDWIKKETKHWVP